MPSRVVRQQLSLTPRQVTALDRLATRLHKSKAELVRDAVDRFLADPPRQAPLPAGSRAVEDRA